MKRRDILRYGSVAGIGSLAGCLSTGSPFGGSNTPNETPPPNRPEGFWRWVNLTEFEPPPDKYGVELDLEITQPWISKERTARIEATLTNKSDVKRYFNPLVLDKQDPVNGGIWIWEDTENRDDPHQPTCTGGDGKADEPIGHSGDQPNSQILAAGESITTIGFIMDDRENRGCFPPRIYNFQREQSVTVIKNQDEGKRVSYDISFSLGIQGENE